jgi:hypothetical protein
MLCLTALGAPDGDTVEATRINYRGWPGSIRLANRTAEVVIVPAIGRIMRFAPTGGPNVLWEDPDLVGTMAAPDRKDWANFGGDKLWPAPQDRWGWPPDPHLDGAPWRARLGSNGSVAMESPLSAATGLRMRRTIRLDATTATVHLRNSLINAGARTVEWSVWEVAQVDDPEQAVMGRSPSGAFPEGYGIIGTSPLPSGAVTDIGATVRALRNRVVPYKIGSDPHLTRLASRRQGWTFRIVGPRRTAGTYPDGGCSVQIYSNPDPAAYMELEVLSPIQRIEPGRSIEMLTTWSLTRGATLAP